MMRGVVVVSIFLIAGSVSLIAAAEEVKGGQFFYRLASEKLVCLVANINSYLEGTGEQIIISVPTCPNIPENPFDQALVAEGPDISFAPDTAPDTLVVLTRKQLQCLANATIDTSHPIYLFYPMECRLEVEK